MSWVYTHTEENIWTVGFYDPLGEWITESDHDTPEGAARRVHYLNGGTDLSAERRIATTLTRHANPEEGDNDDHNGGNHSTDQ